MAREICPYCKKATVSEPNWCKTCGRIFRPDVAPVRESSLAKKCLQIGAAALAVAGVTEALFKLVQAR
jgi:predicted amidophosphoribosyltransferase